jgi:RNA polymerase sigma-70 factor (ECF subfamily)
MTLCHSDRVGATHDFDAIYREAGARLWRSLYAYTAGRGDIAHEAVAEAFARAMERDASIREPIPYLYRTAFRIAAAEMRRQRTVETVVDTPVPEPVDATDLLAALRRISPGQRAAVYLHYQADLPVREVATLMGTSTAVVKVHLSRGRRRLRSLLADDVEERTDV